jgi:hypothetical protein
MIASQITNRDVNLLKEFLVNKNLYVLSVLFLLSVSIAFSGSQYWNEGEIVRGPYINIALDEKMDKSNATFFQLAPTASFATGAASIGTVYMNASGAINYLSTGTTWLKLIATTTGLEF